MFISEIQVTGIKILLKKLFPQKLPDNSGKYTLGQMIVAFSMWRLQVLPMSARDLSGYFSFLPKSKDTFGE